MPRIRSRWSLAFLLAGAVPFLAVSAACVGGAGPDAPAVGPNEGEHHPMVGRAAPDFVGEIPGGSWFRLRGLRGKPALILIFRPRAPFSRELVEALGRLRSEPALASTGFVGIAVDSQDHIERFDTLTNGALPTLRDPGTIAGDYGVSETAAVILVDARGLVRFRMDGFAGPRFRQRLGAVTEALRRLPTLADLPAREIRLDYTRDPRAPVFTARDIDGKPVSLAALRDDVVVLSFFEPDCRPCAQDLARLVPVLKDLRPHGVRAIGVASRDAEGGMRRFMREHGIDYPVVIDADHGLSTRFGSTRAPDLFIIDGSGFIRFREQGDRPDRADLTGLQIRLALGRESPAALAAQLPSGRYLGDGACASCHERERRAWLSTPHSIAWGSLSSGDKWKDPECVACHVTGRGQPGGFSDSDATPHLTEVQCEACHGPGGGHPEGRGIDPAALAAACGSCHTDKFALRLPLDEALSLVAHRGRPDLDRLFRYSDPQRRRLQEINRVRLARFTSGVGHVGAEACRGCHAREHAQWSRTPHAAAYARLMRAGRGADPACTPCHTTGFGLRSGFDATAATAALTGVQCEVCHGPGEDHVNAPPALRKETIYGLRGSCPACDVPGVCAACHDAENDPHFDVGTALPLVRH